MNAVVVLNQTQEFLPVIPSPGAPVALQDVMAIEATVAHNIAVIADMDVLEEMRAKAEALAQYLKGKELHGPMLGAQRRIEARIGQLLGETSSGERNDLKPSLAGEGSVSRMDRNRFRLLARGIGVLADEEWRQPRVKLLSFLREKYPVPRRTPDVIEQKNGTVKKSRQKRIEEITKLAAEGARAGQIADKLGLSEQQVRLIANDAEIVLPDASIGKTRRLDPERIIEEAVSGVSAYASGLSILGDLSAQTFSATQIKDWVDTLDASIKSLKKLSTTLKGLPHE